MDNRAQREIILRLRALADSPDAFGRTLAEGQERSDAGWSKRLSSGANSSWDLPLVAEVDSEPVGLAWGRIEGSRPDVAYLFQMWVAPDYRCQGAGRMLLETVIAWAQAHRTRYVELGVTLSNSPALRLYQRAGFEPAGEPQPLRPGSELLGLPMRLTLTGRDT
ncbi:MAG: GNAT family N-acetyltransferase [Anaerolineae bacterium]